MVANDQHDDAGTSSGGGGSAATYVSAKALNQFLVCPQCTGYFRQPHTIKCCLTTYCRDCLIRCLNSSTSTCPSCKSYLGAKLLQKARPDKQIEAVMRALLPHVFAEEQQREQRYREEHGGTQEHAGITSSAAAVATSDMSDGRKPTAAPPQASSSSGAAAEPPGGDKNPMKQDMYVTCYPARGIPEHLSLPKLQLTFFAVQGRMQVAQFKRYLAKQLRSGAEALAPEEIKLMVNGQEIHGNHSLCFIRRTVWNEKRDLPLPLTYARAVRQESPPPSEDEAF